MAKNIDPLELAHTLSETASKTSDTATAIRLLELARELLAAAGLGDVPPDDDMPPEVGRSFSEPHDACQPPRCRAKLDGTE